MIEILILISFVFLIYIFFYKQGMQEYSINQLDFSNIDKISNLLYEKNPIIINHVPSIPSLLPQTLLKTPRFANILGNYIEKKDINLPHSEEFESFIANESGFHTFGMHMWFSRLHTHPLSEYISSLKTKVCFGSKTLQKTHALYNIIIPIEGKYECSLINSEYEVCLPSAWSSCNNIESITSTTKQLQYIDVILKPGSILIIPANWYYLMKDSVQYSYYGIINYHEPVSIFSEYIENKKLFSINN